MSTEPIKKKIGRPAGSIDPKASKYDPEKRQAQRLQANLKFRQSGGYIRQKIKMNCKTNQTAPPNMDNKTKEQLEQILFHLKLQNFRENNQTLGNT